jgi:uncharacterized protein involved in exopolysaccharide biosynthesis
MSGSLHNRALQWLTWQRILLIAFAAALVVGGIVYLFVPLQYSSAASVLASKSYAAPPGLGSLEGLRQLGLDRQETSLSRMETVLRSRRLRNKLIRKHDLETRLETSHAGALKWLGANTNVRELGFGSGVGLKIQVTCTGSSRAGQWVGRTEPFTNSEAKKICAGLANDYVIFLGEYLTEANIKSARETRDFVRERLTNVRDNLTETEDRLQQLRAQYSLVEPEEKAQTLYSAIQDASESYEETQHTIRELSRELSETRENLTGEEADRIAREVIARNPKIVSLHEKLAGIEAQLAAEKGDGKSDQHPDVRALQSRVQNVRQQLEETKEDVREQVVWQPNPLHDALRDQAIQLEAQLAGLQARRESLEREMAQGEQRMQEFPAIVREYVDTQREQELQSEIAAILARQLELTNIQMQKDTSDAFDLLDDAVVPDKKSGPSTVQIAGRTFVAVFVILLVAWMYQRGLFLDYGQPYQQDGNDGKEQQDV